MYYISGCILYLVSKPFYFESNGSSYPIEKSIEASYQSTSLKTDGNVTIKHTRTYIFHTQYTRTALDINRNSGSRSKKKRIFPKLVFFYCLWPTFWEEENKEHFKKMEQKQKEEQKNMSRSSFAFLYIILPSTIRVRPSFNFCVIGSWWWWWWSRCW